jgi:hypothetical protein
MECHAHFPRRMGDGIPTADLARRALIAVGGDITCAIVEIKPNGDHAEMGAEPAGRDALRRFGAPASAP